MKGNNIIRFAHYFKSYKQAFNVYKQVPLLQTVSFFSNSSKPTNLPTHQILNLPALSPTMDTGNLISWAVKEGDKVEEGDVLAEIETDKASIGFEVVESGYVAKLLVDEGTKGISLGTPICILVDSQDDVEKFKDYVVSPSSDSSVDKNQEQLADEQVSISEGLPETSDVQYDKVSSTNPMVISKALIPHYYLSATINYDQIDILRKSNSNISAMAVIIKAAAIALQKIPDVNSSWADSVIRRYNSNVIKVVRNDKISLLANSDQCTLEQISKELHNAEGKSHTQHSTFTIRFLPESKSCAAIIDPNQAAILCIGGNYSEISSLENMTAKVSNVANVTLSCDHRVVDGAVGAEWLQMFKKLVDCPALMAI